MGHNFGWCQSKNKFDIDLLWRDILTHIQEKISSKTCCQTRFGLLIFVFVSWQTTFPEYGLSSYFLSQHLIENNVSVVHSCTWKTYL